jgi:hypothetical protein
MVEEMINKERFVGKLEGDANVIIHTPVVHSDNDSVYPSKEYADRMRVVRVNLHYAACYEPRTNPYSEQNGGVLCLWCWCCFWKVVTL